MLESITLKGFRKYKSISLEGFSRVNFILGENNVGKTTILEGIYAWACGQNIVPFMALPLARGRYNIMQQPYWIMEEILTTVNEKYDLPMKMEFAGVSDGQVVTFEHSIYPSDIFSEYDSTYKRFMDNIVPRNNVITTKDQQLVPGYANLIPQYNPTLIAKWDIQHEEEIVSENITFPYALSSKKRPYKSAKFIDLLSHTAVLEMVQIYGALKREALLDEVTQKMQEIYPEIQGFDMIPYPDGSQAPVSVEKTDGKILPMYAFGDGVQRWFYIIGVLTLYKNSIVCVDEIDTGFHPKAQVEFCKSLVKYAVENNVQLFITTHNKDFIDEFLKTYEDDAEDLARVFTIKDIDGEIKIRRLDLKGANMARTEYGVELI